MTHKTKECLNRPRKLGARWTGKDIQADEVIQEVELGWDAKRDRWNGYDAAEYDAVVQDYEMIEELRKHVKDSGKPNERDVLDGGDDNNDDDDEDGDEGEEAKYAEESNMGREQSKGTRNLRLREDTAKYLLNLDLDSAKYDPKTRTMVDSGATVDQAAALVAEEKFMRASGDAAEFKRAQLYAWESQERGSKNKQHLQANPTSGEFFRKKEKQEAETRRGTQRKALIDKYGDQPIQPGPSSDMALTESDRYVEYDERGLIKGAPKLKARSKYVEDVWPNNHTSVWGSWWSDFRWGYACCHSTVRNSYCTGEQGRLAFEDAEHVKTGRDLLLSPPPPTTINTATTTADPTAFTEEQNVDQLPPPGGDEDNHHHHHHPPADLTDRKLVAKRTREEMRDGVTEEELDHYRRKRTVADDPMAAFLGKDELVH